MQDRLFHQLVGSDDRDIEMLGDLLQRPAIQSMHVEGDPGALRQFGQRRGKDPKLVPENQYLLGVAGPRGQLLEQRFRQRRFRGEPSGPVERKISNDAIEIAHRVADGVTRLVVLPQSIEPNEGFLDHVFRRGAADDGRRIIDEGGTVTQEELDMRRSLFQMDQSGMGALTNACQLGGPIGSY